MPSFCLPLLRGDDGKQSILPPEPSGFPSSLGICGKQVVGEEEGLLKASWEEKEEET